MREVGTDQERKSILRTFAAGHGMEPEALEAVLRATVVPKDCSREQFAAFIMVAHRYGLNPITKEIYAFPSRGGGIQPIVSIDGWMALINNHPQMDGMQFDDIIEGDTLVAIKCSIYRKDRSKPIEVTEYLDECRMPKSDAWQKWPKRMLRHKAAIQAARYAFGFSGIIDQDEYERFAPSSDINVAEPNKLAPKAPPPPIRQNGPYDRPRVPFSEGIPLKVANTPQAALKRMDEILERRRQEPIQENPPEEWTEDGVIVGPVEEEVQAPPQPEDWGVWFTMVSKEFSICVSQEEVLATEKLYAPTVYLGDKDTPTQVQVEFQGLVRSAMRRVAKSATK